jgi:N-acetylmuramoyl-L-alanine amidase
MKKIFYLILIVAGLTILFPLSSNLAYSSEINILINNQVIKTTVPSFIENDRIFVSARNVVEALGGGISYIPALKLLTINVDNRKVSLVIDDPSLEIDGKVLPLEMSAKIIDNRVMIPLEIIKIIAPVEIKWDSKTKNLSIITIRPYLLKIRSYSYLDKTRVVVDLSEKTEYKADKLINPDRIYVDIMGSTLKLEDSFKQIDINDNIVKTVRTAKFNEDITRVVFDLYHSSRYDVFKLTDPDRIVIDLFRTNKKEESANKIISNQPLKKPAVKPLLKGKRVVIIDPGHGGSDPGAIGPTGLKEKDVTLETALYLEKLLKGAGIPTYLTRDKDEYICLEDRTNFANQKNGFVFVSLHANSVLHPRPSATGTETFVLSSKYIGASAKDVADRENRASRAHSDVGTDLALIIGDLEESANINYSLDFAEIVQKKLVKYLKLKDRGVKQAPFFVLKGANMAAVLVEIAFISDPKEEKLLKSNKFRENTAQALFEAIKYYIENTSNEG